MADVKRRKSPKKKKKKDNNQNMQRKNNSKPHHKGQNNKKSKKRRKGKKGQFRTNLSWGVALILLCLLGAVAYNYVNQQEVTIAADLNPGSSPSQTAKKKKKKKKVPRNFDGLTLKYDHSISAKNKHLVQSKEATSPPAPFLFKANAVRQWNHDKADFTQGFEVMDIDSNGQITLLESHGLYKESKLKTIVLPPEGQAPSHALPQVIKSYNLKDEDFAEGVTVHFDMESRTKSIYQLTWRERKVFVYDLDFKLLRTLDLPKELKEGWGLYHDYESGQFIATDGSANLYFIDEEDFSVVRTVQVKYMNNDREGKDHKVIALKNLNEIEMVNGWILANVWYNTNIYIISPVNGFVYGIIECWKIFPAEVKRQNQRHAVLNGIAFDYVKNQLLITGKNWPKIFAIEVPAFMLDTSA